MDAIRRILVALAQPVAASEPALAKAAQLAQLCGAELELFHCLYDPYVFRRQAFHTRGFDRDIELLVRQTRERLEKRAQALRTEGLRVRTSVHWDYPPYEGIIRQAMRHEVDLVIVSSRRRRRAARLFLEFTDWQLIRLCPVPLLLIKTPQPWKGPTVLAAVDPFHAHAAPAALDDAILQTGRFLSRTLRGRLYVVHAHVPALSVIAAPMPEPMVVPAPAAEIREEARRVRKAVITLASRHGVAARRAHVVTGDPVALLPRIARRSRARIVVMGAVSRSGMKRLFIGDTAQRVLDDLDCDICVVKAPDFRTPVPARNAPRAVVLPG